MITFSKFFLTKGVGVHEEELISFEIALRQAKISPYNIVCVSSIVPPNCELIQCSQENIDKYLKHGQILFSVLSRCSTNEHDRLISASVGVAQPKQKEHYGYLSEYHAFGIDERSAGLFAEDLAAYMLGTTLGMNLGNRMSVEPIWDPITDSFCFVGDLIVKPHNITQTAKGQKGLWTTVIAAACFVD